MARQKYWITPSNSPSQVDKAGECLINPDSEIADMMVAWDTVENWRVAHAYPLKVMADGLRARVKRCDPSGDVAQRLKRRLSITNKLKKERRRLSAMQDIGGCRAIVSDVATVQKLARSYLTSRSQHKLSSPRDYIMDPRPSGYRGVHLPYKFMSKARPEFNNLRVEIQLRTRIQHHWATAVETAGLFLGEDLKGGSGSPEWLRFFALMGSVGAGEEQSKLVPGTPTKWNDLRKELLELSEALHVEQFLQGLTVVVTDIHTGALDRAEYYVLTIDAKKGKMNVSAFPIDGLESARKEYREAEAEYKDRRDAQAVLISVEEVSSLPRAYPNFYADTTEFLRLMKRTVGGPPTGAWKKRAGAS